MNLWTEYEGRTIDGAFPLIKLIRPEGRSAFFSTPNGPGAPTVIRLIESHFDGEDILVRWRGVSALNHPNLVKLKKFGHVVVDETPLVYTVMETVDGNLGEILQVRRLTEEETREIATSLLAAIEALHASGFVHEHVEPANVMAVGEVIKLRSDCIREALEGEEGAALKRKDVRDYAVVLLEALTQKKTLQETLPAPFDEIVRKGMKGEWGLAQIGVALRAKAPVQPVARPVEKAEVKVETPAAAAAPVVAKVPEARRVQVPIDEEQQGGRRWIAYVVGAMVIVGLLVWFFASSRSSSNDAAKPSAAPVPVAQENAPAAPVAETKPAPSVPAAAVSTSLPAVQTAGGPARGTWTVIAFTYNREDQAKQKAAEIARAHPDLNPTVFAPTGHGPYVVALGGMMSKQDAFALSGKAKREGMPMDIYAQNYRNRGN
jgi:eukaryotic-like serine/threonine-protein kinase